MSAWNRLVRATDFEAGVNTQLDSLSLPSPRQYQRLLDLYLQDLVNCRILAGKRSRLRTHSDQFDNFVIDQGHWLGEPEEAPVESLHFTDGAKLGFIITLRETPAGSRLVEATFNLALPPKAGLKFLSIHIEAETSKDPLGKSRSHCHPGFQSIHLPFPIMEPRAILDRIGFEIVLKFRR